MKNLPDATPQMSRIHIVSKNTVTVDTVMGFDVRWKLECHKPGKHSLFINKITISNCLGVAGPYSCGVDKGDLLRGLIYYIGVRRAAQGFTRVC